MKRRLVLGAVMSATLGLPGCVDVLDTGDEEDQSTELTNIVLLVSPPDETLEQIEVELRVRWDQETVHDAVYELKGTGVDRDVLISGDHWPEGLGGWEVSARVDGGEWHAVSSDNIVDTIDCVRLIGMVEQSSSGISIGWLRGRGDC